MGENESFIDPGLVREEFLLLLSDLCRYAQTLRDQDGPGFAISSAVAGTMKRWGEASLSVQDHAVVPEQVQKKPAAAIRPASGEPLSAIGAELSGCSRCGLSQHRTNVVFGKGNPRASIFFVGDAPGAAEDQENDPFAGPSGKLLERIIIGMKLPWPDVFFTNAVKCRPPGDRKPEPEETAACFPFLLRQIAAVNPHVIVALGNDAAAALCAEAKGVSGKQGELRAFKGIPLVTTYSPSFLLEAATLEEEKERKLSVKRDMLMVKNILGLD